MRTRPNLYDLFRLRQRRQWRLLLLDYPIFAIPAGLILLGFAASWHSHLLALWIFAFCLGWSARNLYALALVYRDLQARRRHLREQWPDVVREEKE